LPFFESFKGEKNKKTVFFVPPIPIGVGWSWLEVNWLGKCLIGNIKALMMLTRTVKK